MSNAKITKAAQTKLGDYSLQTRFVGYNARHDKTLLPPNTLVSPSQNVVIKTTGRVSSVTGYTVDGDASTTIDSGILSNFDFETTNGAVRNLRAGFMTAAANDGKLQYRYESATGVVTWRDLKTSLTTLRLSFTEFFDPSTVQNGTNELKKLCLWVDGSNYIYEWNGAITTFASATTNTITKEGTNTWAQDGFYFGRDKKIILNGVEYTYTGGESTTTLTGVTPDPTIVTIIAGDVIHQKPVTTALSAMTSILATFAPTVIGCGRKNQVYLGSSKSNNLYISKQGNYKVYTVSSPIRLVGEGALIVLNAPPTKFIPQEVHANDTAYDMYICEGRDQWAVIRSTLSSDNSSELLEHIVLKVSPLQGARSERLVGKMKNHIMFVGYDNVAGFMGYMSYQYVPVITDFSYTIVNDMNSYDFSDGSIFYHKNYVYIAIPKHGIIRVYNMTDQSQEQYSLYNPVEQTNPQQPFFWEAPITYPISGFYVVDGELYGHGYTTSESYKLFTGGSLNGQDIDYNATFAFDDKGDRTASKASDEIWVEGYIKQNTQLTVAVKGDLDYFQTSQSKIIDGNDSSIVAFGGGGSSLGQDSLGSRPLGSALLTTDTTQAWFHVAKTYPQVPFYLEQISFTAKGVDLEFELLTFGTNARLTTEGNNAITQ